MKRNFFFLSLLTIIALCTTSCSKEPFIDNYITTPFDFSSPGQGDDKKIDVKGSLMNGDMKHPNIQAWLSAKTLYVGFNETIENCIITVFTSGGRVVYSRLVENQRPGAVRIFMGNKPSGDYRLYITNGRDDAEGYFTL